MNTETTILQPRPYARRGLGGRLLLVPLLPMPYRQDLPSELWFEIFRQSTLNQHDLLTLKKVSSRFKDIVDPLFHANASFQKLSSFDIFCALLHSGERRWDSLCRSPHSTPGRWVRTLNLSSLQVNTQFEALRLDSALHDLFPLVPFLSHFWLNPSLILSSRGMMSLANTAASLRTIRGFAYVPQVSVANDSFVKLVSFCTGLVELEIFCRGTGTHPEDNHRTVFPFSLQQLTTLTILSDRNSPFLLCLLISHLPALRKLTVTPSHEVSGSRISELISTHGKQLNSLLLLTPRSWPTRLYPSPSTLLDLCPSLRHLSLESPVPDISIDFDHPLQILSVPRPTPEAWSILIKIISHLPSLRAVRARDVRWLRKGITSKAQEAGVQGELKNWRQRLQRRGIKVLDAEWKEMDP